MKLRHTQAKKGNRVNCYPAYQKWYYGLSVIMRRVYDYYGADSASFSLKHPGLNDAVEGYKSRQRQRQIGIHPQAR